MPQKKREQVILHLLVLAQYASLWAQLRDAFRTMHTHTTYSAHFPG